MHRYKNSFITWLRSHKRIVCFILVAIVSLPMSAMLISYMLISPAKQHIVPTGSETSATVGMVLGAGVNAEGQPYEELQARLDVAAEAFHIGQVEKLLVSGDNRFYNYDEPSAMLSYLVNQKNIPVDKIQRDFAGRSTYESCERAAKIFQLKKTIIFSAGSHLPRAIYLCRHFGIEAYGIGSNREANNSTRRELLARVKAIYNAHFVGEKTILGEPIPLDK